MQNFLQFSLTEYIRSSNRQQILLNDMFERYPNPSQDITNQYVMSQLELNNNLKDMIQSFILLYNNNNTQNNS